jgi:hypothetical protein
VPQHDKSKSPLSGLADAIKAGRVVGPLAAEDLAEQAIEKREREREQAAARPRRPPAGPEDEYGELFASPAERADRRAAAAVQRAVQAASLTDDELREALFAGRVYEDHHAAGAAAAPGHVEFTGQHVHEHSDYSGGRHVHPHSHGGTRTMTITERQTA